MQHKSSATCTPGITPLAVAQDVAFFNQELQLMANVPNITQLCCEWTRGRVKNPYAAYKSQVLILFFYNRFKINLWRLIFQIHQVSDTTCKEGSIGGKKNPWKTDLFGQMLLSSKPLVLPCEISTNIIFFSDTNLLSDTVKYITIALLNAIWTIDYRS